MIETHSEIAKGCEEYRLRYEQVWQCLMLEAAREPREAVMVRDDEKVDALGRVQGNILKTVEELRAAIVTDYNYTHQQISGDRARQLKFNNNLQASLNKTNRYLIALATANAIVYFALGTFLLWP